MANRAVQVDVHVVSNPNVIGKDTASSDYYSFTGLYPGSEYGFGVDNCAEFDSKSSCAINKMETIFRISYTANNFYRGTVLIKPVEAS